MGTAGALIWRLPGGCFGTTRRHPLGYFVYHLVTTGNTLGLLKDNLVNIGGAYLYTVVVVVVVDVTA